MSNVLKVAHYTRTVGSSQSLRIQIEAARSTLSSYSMDRIVLFTDRGSARQGRGLDAQPQLNQMLEMIKDGKIGTVVVYDRMRLAGNVETYSGIIKLFYRYRIHVLFVSNYERPFHQSNLAELMESAILHEQLRRIVRPMKA
ncbi:recombinase family protein [Ferroacidibacillus organovorans]|nr:recombinase family protein [Ferroacidibacillus organovorans]